MNVYVPACEKFPNEDFDFYMKATTLDDETGDTCYDLEANPRCYDCFLIEKCINAIMETLAKSHGVSMDTIVQERNGEIN